MSTVFFDSFHGVDFLKDKFKHLSDDSHNLSEHFFNPSYNQSFSQFNTNHHIISKNHSNINESIIIHQIDDKQFKIKSKKRQQINKNDVDDIVPESFVKTLKLKLKLSTQQKKVFNIFFGAYRFCYNKALDYWNNNLKQRNLNVLKFKPLLNLSNKTLSDDEKWLMNIPDTIINYAVRRFDSNKRTCRTLMKNNHIKNFNMRFKSRKSIKQTFEGIGKSLMLDLKLFPKNKHMKNCSQLVLDKKSKLLYDKHNITKHNSYTIVKNNHAYYLCLSIDYIPKQLNKQTDHDSPIVALDPGIITFQSFYSADTHGKIGDKFTQQLMVLNNNLDKTVSKMDTSKNKDDKRKLKLKCFLLRNKMKNKVDDLHKQTAAYLFKHYDIIMLPEFSTRDVIKKMKKKDNAKTRRTIRSMLQLSHFKFREYMINKSKQYTNKHLIICEESFTSKTCGNCFEINDVGRSRVYKCAQCSCSMDRDINGARNILLKNMCKGEVEIL